MNFFTKIIALILIILLLCFVINRGKKCYELLVAMISPLFEVNKETTKDASIEKSVRLEKECTLSVKEKNMIDAFSKECNQLGDTYIKIDTVEKIKENYKNLFFKCEYIAKENEIAGKFVALYKNLDVFFENKNEKYTKYKRELYLETLSNIKGFELDDRQKAAVLSEEENVRVIAGAGSGKTLTICGKVAVLLKHENIKPEEILLLSYTKASAIDMTNNLKQTIPDYDIKALTFHKLGIEIIKEVEQRDPIIFSEGITSFIKNTFIPSLINGKHFMSKEFIDFIGLYYTIPEDIEEFFDKEFKETYNPSAYNYETLKGMLKKKRHVNSYSTLNKDLVRSVEEVMIANYLFLNGIKYEYEKDYVLDKEAGWDCGYRWSSYRPDFYLSDYDIYLEHFGITKDNRVPWLKKSAEKKYVSDIEKKRRIHQHNETKLMETYSYFNTEGRLISELEKLLDEYGIEKNEHNLDEIFHSEALLSSQEIKQFSDLLGTFLNVFKTNSLSIEAFSDFKRRISHENEFKADRERSFLNIAKAAFEGYSDYLENKKAIDYDDIISKAETYVQQDLFKSSFKYIIIDEFQDISLSRYKLIKALKDKSGAKTFAVGDDWQSIYRFSGSNLSIFINYEKYFGSTDSRSIINTYRNAQELIDISGNFITKNSYQIKKKLSSNKHIEEPIIIYDTTKKTSEKVLKNILKSIQQKTEHNKKIKILLLYRNKKDLSLLDEIEFLQLDAFKEKAKFTSKKYENMELICKTVHSSKGLEADEAIIVNMNGSFSGFPSMREDDPILRYVRESTEKYPYGEERRLMYVALTRTKNRTYIMSNIESESVFVKELRKMKSITHVDENKIEEQENQDCPRCTVGKLKRKKNVYSCNFKRCNFSHEDKTTESLSYPLFIWCDECNGFRVKMKGKHDYGDYYRCYNECGNLNIIRNSKRIEEAMFKKNLIEKKI